MSIATKSRGGGNEPKTINAFLGWKDAEMEVLAKARQKHPTMEVGELASLLNNDDQSPLANRTEWAILAAIEHHDCGLQHQLAALKEHDIEAECTHGILYVVRDVLLARPGYWVSMNGEAWTGCDHRPWPGSYLAFVPHREPGTRYTAANGVKYNVVDWSCPTELLEALFANRKRKFKPRKMFI